MSESYVLYLMVASCPHQKIIPYVYGQWLVSTSSLSSLKSCTHRINAAFNIMIGHTVPNEAMKVDDDAALQLALHRSIEDLHRHQNKGVKARVPPPASSIGSTKLPRYPWYDVCKACNGFDRSLKLGEGGFGPVYRGRLANRDIAVKILNQETYQNAGVRRRKALQGMFAAEVNVLHRYKHVHLVKLLGSSQDKASEGKLALVYELCAGGSLFQRLFDRKEDVPRLSLIQRYIIDLASSSVWPPFFIICTYGP